MRIVMAALLLIATSLPALAQSGPIVNGKDIQPRLPPTQQPVDPDATPLLKDHKDDGPIVQPKDIYGNPLDDAQNPPPAGPAKAPTIAK